MPGGRGLGWESRVLSCPVGPCITWAPRSCPHSNAGEFFRACERCASAGGAEWGQAAAEQPCPSPAGPSAAQRGAVSPWSVVACQPATLARLSPPAAVALPHDSPPSPPSPPPQPRREPFPRGERLKSRGRGWMLYLGVLQWLRAGQERLAVSRIEEPGQVENKQGWRSWSRRHGRADGAKPRPQQERLSRPQAAQAPSATQ